MLTNEQMNENENEILSQNEPKYFSISTDSNLIDVLFLTFYSSIVILER